MLLDDDSNEAFESSHVSLLMAHLSSLLTLLVYISPDPGIRLRVPVAVNAVAQLLILGTRNGASRSRTLSIAASSLPLYVQAMLKNSGATCFLFFHCFFCASFATSTTIYIMTDRPSNSFPHIYLFLFFACPSFPFLNLDLRSSPPSHYRPQTQIGRQDPFWHYRHRVTDASISHVGAVYINETRQRSSGPRIINYGYPHGLWWDRRTIVCVRFPSISFSSFGLALSILSSNPLFYSLFKNDTTMNGP